MQPVSGINPPPQLTQTWQQQSAYYQQAAQQPPQQIQQHSGQELSGAYKAYFDQPDSNVSRSIQQTPIAQAYAIPNQQQVAVRPYQSVGTESQYGSTPMGGGVNAPAFPTQQASLNQGRTIPAQGAWAAMPAAPATQRGPPPPLNSFVGGPPPTNFPGDQRGAYGNWGSQDQSMGGGRPSYNRGPGDYGTPGGQPGYRGGGYDRDRRSSGSGYQGGGGSGRDNRYEQQQFQSKNILYFSGLPQNVNEQFIHDVFSMEQGDIEANSDGSPKIKIYKNAGQSKGECTINFRNEEIAQRIINTYNGQPFPGSEGTMSISFAKFTGGKGGGGGGRPPQRGFESQERNGRQGGQRGGGRGPPQGRDGGNRGRSGGFSRGGGGQGGDGRKGDWTCPCGNVNFAFRRECNSCKAPKDQDGSGGYQSGGGGGGPMRGGGRGGRRGGLEKRDGDWTCACGNVNFAFRRECNSCKSPKGQDGSGGFQSGGGGPMRGGGRGGYGGGGGRSRPY